MTFNFKKDIIPIYNDSEKVIEYLRSKGLLNTIVNCCKCNEQLKEVKYKRHKDQKAFKCMNKCWESYKLYSSLKIDTFFENFNIELIKIYIICYKWYIGEKQTNVIKEYNVSKQ